MLYKPEAFDPLTETPWEENQVRDRIGAIVADAGAAYSPDDFWPADEWDAWGSPLPLINLYIGASGVIWALDRLRDAGYDGTLDLAAAAQRAAERWRQQPDFIQSEEFELPEHAESSLWAGGTGVMLVAYKLAPNQELANDIHARVLANIDSKAVEVMWGPLGSLLAARAMHQWNGDERWAAAWHRIADVVLAKRNSDGLWPTRLWGNDYIGITPPHGLVGNVGALLEGDFLDDATRETLQRDTNAALARAAVVEDGLANWAQPYGAALERDDGVIRVQWCGGAPGIVIAAAPYLDEELLLAGAELTWRAGPHGMDKGSSICHGTAGNGYAFLKTFERTGDEKWLDRARRFAVHALEQVERRGRGRYALFTGDVGVALFAADCIDARARYPITDAR
jgi:Lanthionine synthetase C-like protein